MLVAMVTPSTGSSPGTAPLPPAVLSIEEQVRRAIRWLSEKVPQPDICPVCQNPQWTISPVFDLAQRGPLPWLRAGQVPVLPVFFTICTNCAYTRPFSAAPSIYRHDGGGDEPAVERQR